MIDKNEVREGIYHLLVHLEHINHQLGVFYKHADYAGDLYQQEEYAVDWAEKLVDAADPEKADDFLREGLEDYKDSVEEFRAIRSFEQFLHERKDPRGVEIYKKVQAQSPHLDLSFDVKDSIHGKAEELGLSRAEAAHLKVALEKTVKEHKGKTQ